MNEQNHESKPPVETCGPACSCGAGGGSARMKWVICGLVVLAAAVVVADRVARTSEAGAQAKPGYTAVIPAAAPVDVAKAAPAGSAASDAWGSPLKGLAELNLVATNTEAVFVVVPSGDTARTAAIQKEVSMAASTITSRGTKMGTFLLSRDASDYEGLTRQIAAPAVLVMYKGRGTAAVADKQITQEDLLKAFVGASRPPPAGCGPSGCGPSSTGCN